jgi:ATP-dependent helicase/nuclease subunit A
MEIYQETFDDYGIPYNFKKQQRTFHGFLAGAIKSLLRSIAFPFDKISLVSVLKSPLFGLTNEELLDYRFEGGRFDYIKEQYPENSVINSAFEILREMYFKKRDRKISDILLEIYTKLDIFQIIQLWSDDQEYADILVSILEVTKRYEKEYSGEMEDFINWFDELLYNVEAKRTEIDLLPFDEGKNKLQCITIHSAKGLEFPVVFLSNLCNKTTSSNPDIKDFLNREFEFKIKGSFQTSKYDELKETEHTIEYEEEIRLLYVAMTRARDFLIIPVFYPQNFFNNDEISLKDCIQLKILEDYIDLYSFTDKPDYEQQLNIGKFINERYIIEPDFISSINKKESKPINDKRIENSKDVVSDFLSERENYISSKNSLLNLNNISVDAVSVTELEGDFLFMGGEREGRQIGEIFHKVIEKIDLKSPDNYKELIEYFCTIGGNEHLISIIIELVEKTIVSSIIKRVSQADFHYKEVPISYLLEDKIISGKIDLIFNEKDDFIIVDFKTDNVSDDEWNRRLEHYNTQIQYYKKGFEIITSKNVKETIIFNPLFE